MGAEKLQRHQSLLVFRNAFGQGHKMHGRKHVKMILVAKRRGGPVEKDMTSKLVGSGHLVGKLVHECAAAYRSN